MNKTKLVVLVLAALSASGCVATVASLRPKPTINLPDTGSALILYVDEGVKQNFRVENVEFTTWRSDLAAGFKSGFDGAFRVGQPGGLALRLMDTDISFTCYQYVGCQALLKFKGMLSKDTPGATGARFSGRVQSAVCQRSLDDCSQQAIELMYEEIAKQLMQVAREGVPLSPATPVQRPGDAT